MCIWLIKMQDMYLAYQNARCVFAYQNARCVLAKAFCTEDGNSDEKVFAIRGKYYS